MRLLAGLAALTLASTGCTVSEHSQASSGSNRAGTNFAAHGGPAAKGDPTNDVFSIKASSRAAGNAYGFTRTFRELWAPFRWEVTAGGLDPEGVSVGPGFFCTELDGKDTDPLEYYAVCAQPTGGGLNVFVIRRGNNNVGQVFLPGTNTVDFAIEADGETMTFFARIPGDESWVTVAAIAFSDPGFALQPSVGASQMPANSQVDFDFFRVVENGTKPGATGEEIAGEAAWKVVDALLEAHYALDGGAADLAAADEAYADAEDAVETALALAGGIADEKARKGFTSKLGKVAKDKPVKSVLNPVKGLVKNAALAAASAIDL